MSTILKDPRVLPTRQIAYDYTVAMHFAQRFERDLRAILWTANYHVGHSVFTFVCQSLTVRS
jgi:hypothetical protein